MLILIVKVDVGTQKQGFNDKQPFVDGEKTTVSFDSQKQRSFLSVYVVETVDINSRISYKHLDCSIVANFYRYMQWGLAMMIADVDICPLIGQEKCRSILVCFNIDIMGYSSGLSTGYYFNRSALKRAASPHSSFNGALSLVYLKQGCKDAERNLGLVAT